MLLPRKLAGLPAGRHAKWAILLLWVAIVLVAAPNASRLSGAVQDDSTAELPRGAQSTRVEELTARFPGGELAPGIVAYVRDTGVTAADRTRAEADRRALAAVAAGPIAPAVPSRDGRALMLTVPLADDDHLADNAGRIRDQIERNAPPGLQVRLTGPAGAALDVGDAFEKVDKALLLVTVLLVAAVLLLTYRSPVLWLLPLLTAAVSLQVTGAVVYLLAEHAGLYVADGTSSILDALVFGITTDYALLLLARYREELRRTADRHEAMRAALRRAAAPITASAATVCLGLLCLLAAAMGFNHALGPVGAIGVLGGLAVVMTLLPALLVVLGRWVFWPRIPRHGDAPPARGTLWDRVGRRVAARPRLVWVCGTAVLAALAAGLLGAHTGLDREHFLTTTPSSSIGGRLLSAHYPGDESRPIEVVSERAATPGVLAAVARVPGVAGVGEPEPSVDGRLTRTEVVLASSSGGAAADTVRAVRASAPDALVGAGAAADLDLADAQAHDRRVVIPLVLGVVLLVLMVLLRALVAPLLVVATVVASYFAALGAAWLLFRHAFGFPALDVQVALMGFLFMVALGVDYNLFLVSRVREEAARSDHRTGVLRGLGLTGGVISSAGLVLASTFGVLGLMPVTMMVQIGVLVTLGVLLDTFLVRSVIVPALALDVGRRFWWPGRLAARAAAPARPPEPARS